MSIRAAFASVRARLGRWVACAQDTERVLQALPTKAPGTQASESRAGTLQPEPPRFDGYPYLITPLSPGVFNLMALPSEWPDEMLIDFTHAQVSANRLKSCLALGADRAVYVDIDGAVRFWPKLPASAIVECGALQPAVAFERTADLIAREQWLARFVEHMQARHGRGYGDDLRGAEPATAEERARLEGVNEDGTPLGLEPCPTCTELRGVCLDPVPRAVPFRITVHCRCENHNRCARCGENLFERRLDANYYSRRTGLILYVPGGYARRHRCERVVDRRQSQQALNAGSS